MVQCDATFVEASSRRQSVAVVDHLHRAGLSLWM
jgi:hypothetical protein